MKNVRDFAQDCAGFVAMALFIFAVNYWSEGLSALVLAWRAGQ